MDNRAGLWQEWFSKPQGKESAIRKVEGKGYSGVPRPQEKLKGKGRSGVPRPLQREGYRTNGVTMVIGRAAISTSRRSMKPPMSTPMSDIAEIACALRLSSNSFG